MTIEGICSVEQLRDRDDGERWWMTQGLKLGETSNIPHMSAVHFFFMVQFFGFFGSSGVSHVTKFSSTCCSDFWSGRTSSPDGFSPRSKASNSCLTAFTSRTSDMVTRDLCWVVWTRWTAGRFVGKNGQFWVNKRSSRILGEMIVWKYYNRCWCNIELIVSWFLSVNRVGI